MSRFGTRGLAGVRSGRGFAGVNPGVDPMPIASGARPMTQQELQQQQMMMMQQRGQMPQQQEVPVPPGALAQYYGDIASGDLVPEDVRIEALQYRVLIAPDGTITSESEVVTLISRYNFVLRKIIGFGMDSSLVGPAAALVDFNVREEGRNFSVFKTDISMAALLGGGGNVLEWDGVYITIPGTQLSVSWSVDTARWAALVGATKEFGVTLIGDLVACGPT